jgi:hypothetical protein
MAWKDDTERYGAYVIEQVLSAHIIETDIAGAPPGSVDGEIQYPNGDIAAVEFTSVQPHDLHWLSKKLKGKEMLPAPGKLTWSIHPETVADFNRLVDVHEHIILLTEQYGRNRPDELPFDVQANDSAVRWLAWESKSTMAGYPATGDPKVLWMHPIIASFIGNHADAILEGVEAALLVDPARDHLDKLLRDDHNERHLFLDLGLAGLSAAASIVLMNGPELPTIDPAMPEGVDHLWLGPHFGRSVTVWSRGQGWRNEWLPAGP